MTCLIPGLVIIEGGTREQESKRLRVNWDRICSQLLTSISHENDKSDKSTLHVIRCAHFAPEAYDFVFHSVVL